MSAASSFEEFAISAAGSKGSLTGISEVSKFDGDSDSVDMEGDALMDSADSVDTEGDALMDSADSVDTEGDALMDSRKVLIRPNKSHLTENFLQVLVQKGGHFWRKLNQKQKFVVLVVFEIMKTGQKVRLQFPVRQLCKYA